MPLSLSGEIGAASAAYTETAFESAIENELIAHGGYEKRDAKAFDETLALIPDGVIAILDTTVDRFGQYDEEEREAFRGKLTAFRNLYAFLSQIIPYQDSGREQFYTFVRGLLSKLPPPGDGRTFKLDDEVA